jgi:hypothetical protein
MNPAIRKRSNLEEETSNFCLLSTDLPTDSIGGSTSNSVLTKSFEVS